MMRKITWVCSVAVFLVTAALVAGIVLNGEVVWHIGGRQILRADTLGRPAAIAAIALALAAVTVSRRRYEALCRRFPLRSRLFGVLLIVLVYYGLRGPHILHGDSREYILQTQAMVFRRSIAIPPEPLRTYWNRTNPYGIELGETDRPHYNLRQSAQSGGGFGGLYADRFGRYRYYHYGLYSLAVAPVYRLFHELNPSGTLEYFSFRFVNVMLLAAFFILAWRLKPTRVTLALLILTLFSPLIPYADWHHPEIFCLALAFAAFYLADRKRGRCAAPVLLGMAAAQNVPILLFFPFLLLLTLRGAKPETRRAWAHWAGWTAAGGIIGLSSVLYYLYYYKTPSVIAAIGLADLEYASFTRVFYMFFSPLIGAAVFFPVCVWALPAAFSRKRLPEMAALLGGVVGAAWLASSTANFNAGQVGTVRYAVWLSAPLWYAVFRWAPDRFRDGRRGAGYGAAALWSALLILYFGSGRLVIKDIADFGGAWRGVPRVAAILRNIPSYHPDAEVLAENIWGRELKRKEQFRHVYLWDLGKAHYLWLFSERAAAHVPEIRWSPAGEVSVAASPAQDVEVETSGELVTVRLPEEKRWHRHPVLGNYFMLRTRGRIDKLMLNPRYIIRSDSIETVCVLDARG